MSRLTDKRKYKDGRRLKGNYWEATTPEGAEVIYAATDRLAAYEDAEEQGLLVRCRDLSCPAASGFIRKTHDEAISAWNRRAGKDTNVATNADRIRSMTDEELAEWLVDANMCERVCIEEDYCGCDVCVNRVTDWLKQPVKEE